MAITRLMAKQKEALTLRLVPKDLNMTTQSNTIKEALDVGASNDMTVAAFDLRVCITYFGLIPPFLLGLT